MATIETHDAKYTNDQWLELTENDRRIEAANTMRQIMLQLEGVQEDGTDRRITLDTHEGRMLAFLTLRLLGLYSDAERSGVRHGNA